MTSKHHCGSTRTVSRKARLSKAGHRNLDDLFAQLTWLWNIARHRRKQAWEARSRNRFPAIMTSAQDVDARAPGPRMEQVSRRSHSEAFWTGWTWRTRRSSGGSRPARSRVTPASSPNIAACGSFSLSTPVKTDGRKSWVVVKGVGRIGFKGGLPDGAVKLVRVCRTVLGVKVQLVVERDIEVVPDERPMVGHRHGNQEPHRPVHRRNGSGREAGP